MIQKVIERLAGYARFQIRKDARFKVRFKLSKLTDESLAGTYDIVREQARIGRDSMRMLRVWNNGRDKGSRRNTPAASVSYPSSALKSPLLPHNAFWGLQ